jgi:hypothetical protein
VRLDHIARVIVNANHSIMRPAENFGLSDGAKIDFATSLNGTRHSIVRDEKQDLPIKRFWD